MKIQVPKHMQLYANILQEYKWQELNAPPSH